jgi:hypothetical protein
MYNFIMKAIIYGLAIDYFYLVANLILLFLYLII